MPLTPRCLAETRTLLRAAVPILLVRGPRETLLLRCCICDTQEVLHAADFNAIIALSGLCGQWHARRAREDPVRDRAIWGWRAKT